MREELLHFIWQHRYFRQQELQTVRGEPLLILSTGQANTNQGPDFLHARARIGGTLFEGSVELHLKTSDWNRHAHEGDNHYRNVILHVVWENDLTGPPNRIPILELRHRTSHLLLQQYGQWMQSRAFVPCERRLPEIAAGTWEAWQHSLLVSRLRQRTLFIRSCLEDNNQHWDETTWWLMARSMGQPVNTAAFEAIARSLPHRILMRHRHEPARLEALLLGQAGLLEPRPGSKDPALPDDDHFVGLLEEYRHLRTKYGLRPVSIPLSLLRMRPAHFPTVRLPQLARLAAHPGWFAAIREARNPRELLDLLDLPDRTAAASPGDARMGAAASSSTRPSIPRRLGPDMQKGILINAFIPLRYAYGSLRGAPADCDKALAWLRATGPETNAILKNWEQRGVTTPHSASSQALLELKKNYCDSRRCLDCAVGCTLLGRVPGEPLQGGAPPQPGVAEPIPAGPAPDSSGIRP